jgi:hypothetical protein
VSVQDNAQPGHGGGDASSAELSGQSPEPPDQALAQMAHDRLVAAGNSGTAVFTIDQASITGQPGGPLDGHLSVHLDVLTGSGGHAGYAEAHVSRQFVPGTDKDNGGLRAELYDLTRQMMQDMNVELEFQVRRSLRDWLVDASGAPVAGSVEQQDLAAPGAAPPSAAPGSPAPAGVPSPVPSSVGAPMQLAPTAPATPAAPVPIAPGVATPNAVAPEPAPPQALSPPPSFLTPPPGASAVAPPVAPDNSSGPIDATPPVGAPLVPNGY